jgi:hypothetical protein
MRITALWLTVCAAFAFAAPAFGEETKQADAKAEKVANKSATETPAAQAAPAKADDAAKKAAAKDEQSKASQ